MRERGNETVKAFRHMGLIITFIANKERGTENVPISQTGLWVYSVVLAYSSLVKLHPSPDRILDYLMQ